MQKNLPKNHPKSKLYLEGELKWTKMKDILKWKILFSQPKTEKIKIIEVSSWEKLWNSSELFAYIFMFNPYFTFQYTEKKAVIKDSECLVLLQSEALSNRLRDIIQENSNVHKKT